MSFTEDILEFEWHGRGGQGVVTANQLLGSAALKEGKYIQAFPEFGPERTGAPVKAFLRISDKVINIYSQVQHPDVAIVIDPTLLSLINPVEKLKEDGTLIVNSNKTPKEIRDELNFHHGKLAIVNASEIALSILKRMFYNTPMLGAVVAVTNVVKLSNIEDVVIERFGEKLGSLNIQAIKKAAEEVIIDE